MELSTRSGKILTVKLRNFMCHANLTVDFNRRTNLLIGQNGSGKSAILTALIIGLGSKANATNRSSSIKGNRMLSFDLFILIFFVRVTITNWPFVCITMHTIHRFDKKW